MNNFYGYGYGVRPPFYGYGARPPFGPGYGYGYGGGYGNNVLFPAMFLLLF